ncbi:hypothetical protein ACJJTC_007038 [Scirpophaga incertulas]
MCVVAFAGARLTKGANFANFARTSINKQQAIARQKAPDKQVNIKANLDLLHPTLGKCMQLQHLNVAKKAECNITNNRASSVFYKKLKYATVNGHCKRGNPCLHSKIPETAYK